MEREPSNPRLVRAVDEHSDERFVEVVGRRIALLGNERGVFELWIWPLKIAHALAPRFRTESGECVAGPQIAREVAVEPQGLSIRYAHARFSVELSISAALDARALVFAFRVESREALAIELEFTPDFRPMWPAGLGGQIAARDDESGAFVLTEELGRFAALCGSPEAEPTELDLDHALPRDAVTITLPVSVARAAKGPIPFFIVGAEVQHQPLSAAARVGEEGAARGTSRARAVVAQARELYRRSVLEWPDWKDELVAHWRAFFARTLEFHSSRATLDASFRWSKIALERAWVEVDGLGRGLVAGLATSGSSERPGFGWFFDGDALCAARAMSLAGHFEFARRVFEFAASHQRADGKLMHELVLSARLCQWIDDYPYAYYKGVNTPDFIGALRVYLDVSGDRAFVDRMWPVVSRAFEHALSCVDERGLYSVRRAGIAAVEAGPLVGRLESEVFAHGLWIEALLAMGRFASVRGERELAERVARERARAIDALQHFWDGEQQAFVFARLVDGERWPDLTAYHGALLALELESAPGGRLDLQLDATARRLNEPRLASDWGLRMFPEGSAIYDAASYNHGSVFPYLNDFAIRALFARGQVPAAHQLLDSLARLDGFSGLGFIPEHLVGDRARAPQRGVPHQIFSSAGLIQSSLLGLAGLKFDALTATLELRPAFPLDLDFLDLAGVAIGASRVDVHLQRERLAGRSKYSAIVWLREGPKVRIRFAPRLAPLSFVESRSIDGVNGSEGELARTRVFDWLVREGPTLAVEPRELERDARSSAPRILATAVGERRASWTVYGRGGARERLRLHSDRALHWRGASFVTNVDPARASTRGLDLEFPSADGFAPVEIQAELAD